MQVAHYELCKVNKRQIPLYRIYRSGEGFTRQGLCLLQRLPENARVPRELQISGNNVALVLLIAIYMMLIIILS